MEFLEAKEIMKQKMGDWKIMALASCEDNYPMVRNVSCLFYNDTPSARLYTPPHHDAHPISICAATSFMNVSKTVKSP